MLLKRLKRTYRAWGKRVVSSVLIIAVTCTSAPLSAFAPAYAAPLAALTKNTEWGGGCL